MDKQFEELVVFIGHGNKEVRKVAINNLASLSTSEECLNYFKQSDMKIFVSLLKDEPIIAVDSLSFLINVTRDSTIRDNILKNAEIIQILSEMITNEKDKSFCDYSAMLLSNLTLSQTAIDLLLKQKDKLSFINILQLLPRCYKNQKQNLHYLALVFANVTQTKEGREQLLADKKTSPLIEICKILITDKLILRGGLVSGVKNCCFEVKYAEWFIKDLKLIETISIMLAKDTDLDEEERKKAPKYLLDLPKDKKRESDMNILSILLEIVLILCSTNPSIRNIIRDSQLYPIVRETDKEVDEKFEHIKQTIYGIVNMLIRDDDISDYSNKEKNEEEEISVIED